MDGGVQREGGAQPIVAAAQNLFREGKKENSLIPCGCPLYFFALSLSFRGSASTAYLFIACYASGKWSYSNQTNMGVVFQRLALSSYRHKDFNITVLLVSMWSDL